MAEPNDLLRAARERQPSRRVPGDSMSRAELADAVAAWLWNSTGKRHDLDVRTIARWERGAVRWPNSHYRAALRHVLGATDDTAWGFAPQRAETPPQAAENPPRPDRRRGRWPTVSPAPPSTRSPSSIWSTPSSASPPPIRQHRPASCGPP
ncbi:hypothetical protein ACFQV2_16375 [Actinokineospora soli]|uniref:XRE family transcriptional regulator n=1 Tax=Actinokineospora soli TaxID=1048753 RepID=A0ABW2TM52_9PSEU